MNLLNPWVLLGGLASLVAAFFLGVYMEHGRFMGFVAEVKIQGEAAARQSAERKAANDKLKEEKDNAHEKNRKELAASVADLGKRLRDARAGGRVVPAPAKPAGGGDAGATGRLCYRGEALRAGIDGGFARFEGSLQRFEEGTVGRIQRGANALSDFNTCAGWAQEVVKE